MAGCGRPPIQFDRCAPLGEEATLDWCASSRLRDRLIEEVRTLERELDALIAPAGAPDFSMQQTCREMIHERQALIRQLPR